MGFPRLCSLPLPLPLFLPLPLPLPLLLFLLLLSPSSSSSAAAAAPAPAAATSTSSSPMPSSAPFAPDSARCWVACAPSSLFPVPSCSCDADPVRPPFRGVPNGSPGSGPPPPWRRESTIPNDRSGCDGVCCDGCCSSTLVGLLNIIDSTDLTACPSFLTFLAAPTRPRRPRPRCVW
jgi:hypothetical protein